MKTTLITATLASLALFLILSWAFDSLQASSRADAAKQEASVAAIVR